MIVIDNNDVYFVVGLLEENNDIFNENIINIDIEDGIFENGKSVKVLLVKVIDLLVIYKMNYDEFIFKI